MAEMYAVTGDSLRGIANAIRSKTGSEDFMPVSAMADAIQGISGGGLPFASKITFGTYVPEQDEAQNKYFYHNLGAIPKMFIIYTNDITDDDFGTYNFLRVAVYVSDSVTDVDIRRKAIWSSYQPTKPLTTSYTSYGTDFGLDPSYMNETRIYIIGRNTGYRLKGGARYNWIAIA